MYRGETSSVANSCVGGRVTELAVARLISAPPWATRPPPCATRPPPCATRPPPWATRPPPWATRPPPCATRPPPCATRPPPCATRPPPVLDKLLVAPSCRKSMLPRDQSLYPCKVSVLEPLKLMSSPASQLSDGLQNGHSGIAGSLAGPVCNTYFALSVIGVPAQCMYPGVPDTPGSVFGRYQPVSK